MKVIIQIPCLNEEQTLPLVLKSIPKQLPGVDSLEIMIIDDGSTDKTVEVAKKLGVKHFVLHSSNQGLARAFHDGINKALELGADIVVNTDGDNQYPQKRIGDLIQPIIDGQADIVIADRQTQTIEHFSPLKKFLQRFGSSVVNKAAGTNVPDAPSGFRAYSREAMFKLNTITRFTYTVETIIQAGNKNLKIVSLPVTTNPKTRESRLFKSLRQVVLRQMSTIIRSYIMYKPYVIFGWLGGVLFVLGVAPIIRFLYFLVADHSGRGHLQSLIIGSTLLISAFLCFTLNIIADLIRINRFLIEDNLEHTKRLRFDK